MRSTLKTIFLLAVAAIISVGGWWTHLAIIDSRVPDPVTELILTDPETGQEVSINANGIDLRGPDGVVSIRHGGIVIDRKSGHWIDLRKGEVKTGHSDAGLGE